LLQRLLQRLLQIVAFTVASRCIYRYKLFKVLILKYLTIYHTVATATFEN